MKGLDGLANYWGGGGLLTTGAVGLAIVSCLFLFLGNNYVLHMWEINVI